MRDIQIALYGIKGSGMAALALYLDDFGVKVMGYDTNKHLFTEEELQRRQIAFLPFDTFGEEDCTNFDLLIFSTAFKEEARLKKLKLLLPCMEYHEFLSFLMRGKRMIGVSGTHGKTTLVGMIDQVCDRAFNLIEGDGIGRFKDAEYSVIECCEYQDHFLSYRPWIGIITSIELDHTDYFDSFERYLASFKAFGQRADNLLVSDLYKQYFPDAITVGSSPKSDYRYLIKSADEDGFIVDFIFPHRVLKDVRLNFFGEHMVKLGTFALAIGDILGRSVADCVKRLQSFDSVKRRLNISRRGLDVFIDDYAHQPSQIENVLKAARQISESNRTVCVFLPDRLSRLRDFFFQFKAVLEEFDQSYLVDVDLSKKDLIAEMIKSSDKIARYDEKVGLDPRPTTFLFLSSKKIDDLLNQVVANREALGLRQYRGRS